MRFSNRGTWISLRCNVLRFRSAHLFKRRDTFSRVSFIYTARSSIFILNVLLPCDTEESVLIKPIIRVAMHDV